MQTFKTILLPLLLTFQVLSLVGCDLPKPKDRPDGQTQAATFAVESPVRGSSLPVKNSNAFTFPTDKIFNFVVCLKDVAYDRIIAGHVFQVKEINKDVTTDKSGCLNWSEDMKYNYLAAPEYIQIQRTIVAKGLHRGVRQVNFAVNPWSEIEKVPDVLDADKNTIPQIISDKSLIKQVLQGMDDTNIVRNHPLYVADGNLQVTQQNISADNSGVFSLEARIAPQVQMTKLNGDVFYQALTAGKFKATLKIIHSYIDSGKNVHHLLAQTPPIDATLKNGFLTLDSGVQMVMPTRGQLILGLELNPVDGPSGLGDFQGIFVLGDFDQFKGNMPLKLNTSNAETNNFLVHSFITDPVNNLTMGAPLNPDGISGTASGTNGSVTPGFAGSTNSSSPSANGDVYERRIAVENFTYNLKSNDYQIDSALNMVMIKKFQVMIAPHIVASSDQSMNFSDSPKLRDGKYLLKMAMVHNFDYENSNTYVTSSESIVRVADGSIDTELDFVIHDLAEVVNRNNILLEIYPVDESKVQVVNGLIIPKAPKASLDSVIDTTSTLLSPTFIGTMFLSLDDANRVVHTADLQEAQHFLIKDFQPQKATGLIAKAIEQGQQTAAKALATPKTTAEFAAQNNLDLINVKQLGNKPLRQALQVNTLLGVKLDEVARYQPSRHLEDYDLKVSEMAALIHNKTPSQATMMKLCAFWGDYLTSMDKNKGGAIGANFATAFTQECVRKATSSKDFFQVERRLFVKEIEQNDPQHKPTMLHGTRQDLGIGTNFSLSAYHTQSQTSTWSMSAKGGLSLRGLSVLSMGFDGGYGISWATSNSQSKGNTVSMTSNLQLTVMQNTFALRFNKYEQCAVIHLNPHLFVKQEKAHWYSLTTNNDAAMLNSTLSDEEKAIAVTHGLLICDGTVQTTPLDRIEDYSLVFQNLNLSQTQQDMGDARNRNFYLALRSANDLEAFLAAIKGTLSSPTEGTIDQNQVQQTNGALIDLFNIGAPSAPGTYLDNN